MFMGDFVKAIFMGGAAAIGFFTVKAIKEAWSSQDNTVSVGFLPTVGCNDDYSSGG
jgi:hypothetical protein